MMTFWMMTTALWITSNCVWAKREQELLKYLFSNYEARSRPVNDPKKPVYVNASYYLLAVEDLSEKSQVLRTYGWLNLFWKDESLSWNPAQWGGIDEVVVPATDVWKPDTVIKNSVNSVYGDILDEEGVFRVQITADGTVDFWTSGDLQTSCQVDMTYFPFDDQACMIQLDSWTSSTKKMVLVSHSNKVSLSFYRESGQWDIIDTEAVREVIVYVVDEFDYIRFFIYMRRKPMYFVYNIVLPSVLLSLLVLLIFLLPADAGEKISLGITVLLSFSVFQLIIADSMPKTSDFLPVIGIYIICTMVVTALSLLFTVCILVIHHHDPSHPVPPNLRRLAKFCSTVICMKTSLTPVTSKVHPNDLKPSVDMVQTIVENFTGTGNVEKPTEVDMSAFFNKLSGDVAFLREARVGDDETASRKDEWVEVARILDRLFLVFFLAVILITSLVLFVFYPLSKAEKPVVLGLE